MLVNILLFQPYSCQICNLLYYYSQYYASIIGSGLLFAAIFGLTPINTAIHWKKSYISSTTIYKGHAKDRSNFLHMLGTCIGMSLFCFYFHLFFFLAILLFLAYYAQYFARSRIFCSKFSCIASYLTVISHTYIPKL